MNKKFKSLFYVIMLGILLYTPSVMALSCTMDEKTMIMVPDGGKSIEINAQIPNTVHTIIVIIKIAIPVLLVILGMLDLLKGVTASKEDEIKKGQALFLKRLIAAVLLFFIITIVQLLVSFVSDKTENIMGCANCFINGKCGDQELAIHECSTSGGEWSFKIREDGYIPTDSIYRNGELVSVTGTTTIYTDAGKPITKCPNLDDGNVYIGSGENFNIIDHEIEYGN